MKSNPLSEEIIFERSVKQYFILMKSNPLNAEMDIVIICAKVVIDFVDGKVQSNENKPTSAKLRMFIPMER
jgi:hypothetical protein